MSGEYDFGFEDGYEPGEEPRRQAPAESGPGGLAGRDPQTLGSIVVTAVNAAAVSYMNTIDTEQSAIRQKIRDLGSTWAMPNLGDLSDASVRDGSGWRPGS